MSTPMSPPAISRRGMLLGTGSLAMGPLESSHVYREILLDFPDSRPDPGRASLLIPGWQIAPALPPLPMLVALHGRGESIRGLDVGAHAWMRDYGIGRATERLRNPPLHADDFFGFVDPDRLVKLNGSLAQRPFRGLALLTPWVPDFFNDAKRDIPDAGNVYGRFLVETLLPEARKRGPGIIDPGALGIDGVSLGGRGAWLAGLAFSGVFRAVGTLQAAIRPREVDDWATLALRARAGHPDLKLRLVTSTGDPFRPAIGALHDALVRRHVAHDHLVTPGPHDYVYNRGVGAIEMLLWHDRVLRGEPAL